MDVYEEALRIHELHRGKLEVRSLLRVDSPRNLTLAYTPGVARPCEVIGEDPAAAWNLTMKGRTVAVVSDGSAILGLGDLGPEASLPVMEGKAVLFKEFGGIDAVPVVLDATDPDDIVDTIRRIAPTFGGINLEDISAPRCFEIEERLQDLDIPVLHDDQHGTAIVCLAAIQNALKVVGKSLASSRIVISGAGAAGPPSRACSRASTGRSLHPGRRSCSCATPAGSSVLGRGEGLDPVKAEMLEHTNRDRIARGRWPTRCAAPVFVGVSRAAGPQPGSRTQHGQGRRSSSPWRTPSRRSSRTRPSPRAAVVGTGRSDFPNQVNNVLAFPGLFRGALEVGATRFTSGMKFAAIDAIASCVQGPSPTRILPAAFDRSVAFSVGRAVAEAAHRDGVARIP